MIWEDANGKREAARGRLKRRGREERKEIRATCKKRRTSQRDLIASESEDDDARLCRIGREASFERSEIAELKLKRERSSSERVMSGSS